MSERNPTIHKIKGVLFDFDGTLTQPGGLNFLAIKREIGCPEGTPILDYMIKRLEEILELVES